MQPVAYATFTDGVLRPVYEDERGVYGGRRLPPRNVVQPLPTSICAAEGISVRFVRFFRLY